MKDKVPGSYYSSQLTKAPNPNNKKHFFEVEKILKKKTINKKLFYYVKFLYYPPKFNEYVPAENVISGS
jgi:hypothetical protein